MPTAHELVSEQFYRWERRGRGWQVFDSPITPEPAFVPFHFSMPEPAIDDGRRPTLFSSLVQGLGRALGAQTQPPVLPPEDSEPEPEALLRQSVTELQFSLPRDFDTDAQVFRQFLQSIFPSDEPISFEVLAQPGELSLQLAVPVADSSRVKKQIDAFFPEVAILEGEDFLASAWEKSEEGETAVIEFGLAREFMLPLTTNKLDSYVGLVAPLIPLGPDELGLFQVIFEPARAAWGESIFHAVSHADGKPLFVNEPELTKAAEAKAAEPLFAAVVRIATRAPAFDRAWNIARDMASALRVFADPTGNELIPLHNDGYPPEAHEEDVLLRQTRRSGMLLTLEELLGFVHLPSTEVPKLARELTKTKAAPNTFRTGVLIGHNTHAGKTMDVRLSPEQRVRHTHIIGASGTGKTTLLYNLIRQDIENGQGLAVLDPHGDLVDRILGIIPQERIQDVVLVDAADEEYSIGFNILSAHSDLEKHLLASDLVSVFQRLSSSWGDQLGSVLQKSISAFLESSKGGTLADLRRFLIEPVFRADFLKSVHDPEVLYYWQKAFPQLTGNKSIGPVLTRLETFLAPKPIRYMVSQPRNRLDFRDIMDTGKIFLAKLSEGLLGKENSYLLGALLVAKFQQLAMGRQAQRAAARRDFWLYMDEFQNFITPSLAEILTGARKYRLGLILAHHELRQLERDKEVASAVLSNCYTRVVFRVGDDDARKLADGFAFFDSRDLQNLAIGQAVCRVERSDNDFNLAVPLPEEPSETEANARRNEVTRVSRERYATPRAEVETMLLAQMQSVVEPKPSAPSPPPVTKQSSPIAQTSENEDTATVPKTPTPLQAEPVIPPPAPPKTVTHPAEELRSTPAREHPVARDLGRGGAQHQAIQQRIKLAAAELGFRSTIEKPVLDGQGSVDLFLERGDQTIACEISITTTIDHEVGNVIKCLKADLPRIAVICTEEDRLKRIEAAVIGALGSEGASRILYFQPDPFILYLRGLPHPTPKHAVEKTETRRGYKIKRSIPKLSPEEQKLKEDAAIKSIAETMRNPAKR